jgi:AraC-like DNA-binding protein
MILEHKTFELFGKQVFERAVLKTPSTVHNPMPDEACLLFVSEGSITSYAEGERVTARANEGILMKCGTFLGKVLNEKPEGTYEAMAVHFYPDVLKKVFDSGLPSFLQNHSSNDASSSLVKVEGDELYTRFFEGMVYYFAHPELVNDELIVLKLKEILLLLSNTQESSKLQEILSSLFAPQVYDFKQIVQAHLFDPLSLEELAFICGLSLSTFKRNFQAIYQESPAKYIRVRRLEKSKELLQTTDLSISEIAFQMCFNDPAVFSKAYKNLYGKSPKAFRSEMD